ncbi:Tnks [Symbiodinium natans]|uniref:Tnks protein n=1 Tax=Symbiodinium natans TaxID=878477 RepID=A0A812MMQ8_9DINO|nr:Tnks [Symbiodinium natans]
MAGGALDFTEYDLDQWENAVSDDESAEFARIQEERQRRRTASQALEPIWNAAESGNLEILSALGVGSPRVNAKDMDGFTPAAHAVFAGQLEAFKLLVSKGANLLAGDTFEGSPLKTVIRFCVEEVYVPHAADPHAFLAATPPEYLTYCLVGSGLAASHEFALKESRLKGLTMVVQMAGPGCINMPCRYKQKTPVHYAAAAKNTAALRFLIDAWADLSAKDKEGKTALQCAQGAAVALLHGAARERRLSVLKPLVLYHHQSPSSPHGQEACTRRAYLKPGLGGQVREGIEIWTQLTSVAGSRVLEFLLGGPVCIKQTWLHKHFVEVATLTHEVSLLQSRVRDLEQSLAREQETCARFKMLLSTSGMDTAGRSRQLNCWNCWAFCR